MTNTLIVVGLIILSFTVLPLVRSDYWTFRVFDYPRIQKLVLTLCWMMAFIVWGDYQHLASSLIAALMVANAVYLGYLIYPFTILGAKQVKRAKHADDHHSIRILISNVYEKNRNVEGCLSLVRRVAPDMVLLLETNERWADALSPLEHTYPAHIKIPLNNTYGMLLYSRFPLIEKEIRFLVDDDVPSIRCQVQLPSGQQVQVYAVHPTPPVPNENPRSTERDKELLLIADEVKNSALPTIVVGDLNDVAWSYTTTLFLKISGLLDPRRGRGFFNTFHAHYPFLRFPLDHAFTSPHFKLRELRKEDNFDSDHFPILVHLQFEKQAKEEQEKSMFHPDQEDKAVAEEKKQADT
ncbi:endonuclease/exonuclease/phosphatase (EEP) superfamily protein YafD [Sphingobacterium allocomposti]|uniref:Endonuclease/exonuclease/phosphatase (EEP) superfamily protein YafD n=1 Tax=Sphingobacterium allocomposti TaxID=415956 RepID=A0A5S5DMS9_9SPHI|nr:endonuclease/exonuclease/phosphatase family protein [Sphingobacterium composti Yoo et al. 2007 non Ten et al. 2007]TYP97171.1 endonuclease/exonuclease/phosphatase (EEP) superfamily protein YafD [Sphingobacterium composti Yoo et al. 2007 non Ten et al. 2007]